MKFEYNDYYKMLVIASIFIMTFSLIGILINIILLIKNNGYIKFDKRIIKYLVSIVVLAFFFSLGAAPFKHGRHLITEKETDKTEPSNCINCGLCAKKCPMRLMPMYIEAHANAGDFLNAEKYGAMNCIECGLCTYNCPAKRSLVQSIVYAKGKIKEMKKNG
jgi:ferredoxin